MTTPTPEPLETHGRTDAVTEPEDGADRFAAFVAMLEGMEEFRGDGASPQEVLAAYPELASVEVSDVAIAGPHGPVPARLYRPGGPEAPVVRASLVWVHGGAFVMGTLDMAESHAVGLVLAHRGIAVLALDYRKALRGVRHPVPLDDVAAGWQWALDHPEALGDGAPLHLGGASAGGALAAGLALRLRDEGAPTARSLVLAYTSVHADPVLDRDELARIRRVAPPGEVFDEGFLQAAVRNYAGTAAQDPYAFAGSGDPRGLPPALVLTCELDSLRFSAEQWARDVAASGGVAVLEQLPGATHGVLDRPASPHGRAMLARIGDWLLEDPPRP